MAWSAGTTPSQAPVSGTTATASISICHSRLAKDATWAIVSAGVGLGEELPAQSDDLVNDRHVSHQDRYFDDVR